MSPSRQRWLAEQAKKNPQPKRQGRRFVRKTESKQPQVGSQLWAETRGDDLGYSGDR